MSVKTNLAGATNYVLQEAISAYADEAYTSAKKLSGTGIVGGNSNIDTNTETFIGQIRWEKPLNPVIWTRWKKPASRLSASAPNSLKLIPISLMRQGL